MKKRTVGTILALAGFLGILLVGSKLDICTGVALILATIFILIYIVGIIMLLDN